MPLLAAVPVLWSIGESIATLLAVANPKVEYAVMNDAEALFFGVPLYADPAEGFSGMIYTPLFPALVSLLVYLADWTGWPLLVGTAMPLVLVALAARLAYAPRSSSPLDRTLAVGEGLGLGALAWVLVSTLETNGVYAGLHDAPAWTLALLGLVLVPLGASRGSRGVLALAALVLTAAVWTKQPAVVAGAAAVAWLALEAGARRVPWRRVAAFAAGLSGLNLLILGAMNLVSSGWQYLIQVEVPARHPLGELGATPDAVFGKFAQDLLGSTGLALLFAGTIWLALSLRSADAGGLARRARRWGSASGEARLALLLGLAVVAAALLIAVSSFAIQRTANQTIAVGWALCLIGAAVALTLGAVAWAVLGVRVLRRRRPSATTDADADGARLHDPGRRWSPARVAGIALAAVVGLYAGARFYDQFAKIGFRNFPSIPVAWGLAMAGAAVALGLTVALFGLFVARLSRDDRAARGAAWTFPSSRAQVASALALFVIVSIVSQLYTRNKYGADDHYYIGIVWGLGLLAAAGYGLARPRLPTAAASTAAVTALVLVALVGPSTGGGVYLPGLKPLGDEQGAREQTLTLRMPGFGLRPVKAWVEESAELDAYARRHAVYDPENGGLNVRRDGTLYPEWDNWYGLVAAGVQPRYLIDALMRRRFEAVKPFDPGRWSDDFTGRSGLLEENYFWKLDQVVKTHYEASSPPPVPGFLARRPGPDPAPWMRDCFGPFRVAGRSFRIDRGGGFWCQPSTEPGVLALRDTPAPFSDVRTERPVGSLEGTLGVALPRGAGAFEVILEPTNGEPWRVRGEARPKRGMVISATRGRRVIERLVLPGSSGAARVELRFGPAGARLQPARAGDGAIEVGVPDLGDAAVLRLAARRASEARFDLRGLRVG